MDGEQRRGVLAISPELSLSLEAVTETFGILAKRGAGKSNAAVVMAEQMFDHGLPWVAIDPKGDWWGVRSSMDGTGPGLPVLVFGGRHADVPLESAAGRVVADLVAAERVTCILDVSLMSKADQRRFLADFAERLYTQNTDPLHIFAEEAHEYIPQRVTAADARMVGAWEKLVKWGRTQGIGVTLITQRSASLNKDVLTQVETLIVLRTTGPQDQAAIRAWVDEHETGAAMVSQLRRLSNGEAFVLSPHWLELEEPLRIRFARRRTFDSGATPRAGERRAAPRTLADVDLAAIKEAMAETIEKAEAEDPKRLHARIRDLEQQRAERGPSRAEQYLRGAMVGLQASLAAIARDVTELIGQIGRLDDELPAAAKEGGVKSPIRPAQTTAPGTATSGNTAGRPAGPVGGSAGQAWPAEGVAVSPGSASVKLGRTELRILAVLAQHGPRSHRQMALQTGYSARASTIGVGMARLRKLGYAGPGQPYQATSAGVAALQTVGGYEPLPTGPALLGYWRGQLGKTENKVLDALLAAYPAELNKAELAEATGYSERASTIGVALSKLRRLELVEGWGISDEFAAAIR